MHSHVTKKYAHVMSGPLLLSRPPPRMLVSPCVACVAECACDARIARQHKEPWGPMQTSNGTAICWPSSIPMS